MGGCGWDNSGGHHCQRIRTAVTATPVRCPCAGCRASTTHLRSPPHPTAVRAASPWCALTPSLVLGILQILSMDHLVARSHMGI